MEHIEGEWTSLSGMYTAEEVDFMSQLLGNFPFSNQLSGAASMSVPEAFWPAAHESITINMSRNYEGSHYSSETSPGSNCSDGNRTFFPTSSNESYHMSESLPMLVSNSSNGSMSIDFGTVDVSKNINSYLIEGDHDQCLNQENINGNVEETGDRNQPEPVSLVTVQEKAMQDKSTNPSKVSMKRSQSLEHVSI